MNTPSLADRVRATIRVIPDYPKPGVQFQDITPVLADGPLFQEVVAALAAPFAGAGVTHVLGIEARGFILGGAVAAALGAGFVPARKPGKLPWERVSEAYELEGRTTKVLVVDDVLATGGTAAAAGRLAQGLGAVLAGWTFLLEIGPLEGRKRLGGTAPSVSLLTV
jgi:adenine phosphoribosyltransferase